MKNEQMTKDIWYDCWLTATVCLTEKTAKEIDANNWLRQTVNSALHPWHVCDERDLVETSSSSHCQNGENILCLTLTSRHFDFFHGPFEDGNAILAEWYARLRYQLPGKCSFAEVEISGHKRDRIPDIFVHFEVECDPPNKVIREKVWDATVKKYVESTEWKPRDKTTGEEG